MPIEYLSTAQVAELLDMTPRQARKVMRDVGLVKIGHGMVRRDALDRYLALNTECTYYTRPLLDKPIKPKYDRYARTRKEA